MSLKVVDLYSGAGGFAEGFRQLGFKVVAGFDNWDEARVTFKNNHRDALVPNKSVDISRNKRRIINLIKKRFGHIKVIVGGPPCVEFSSSKNGGRGNIKDGIHNVKAFFDIVRELEPDYWVMENVPRIKVFLNESINKGVLTPPPNRDVWIFNSQYHGVPQARKRLFTGNFPGDDVMRMEKECKESGCVIPMRVIIDGLPKFSREPVDNIIQDPLYPELRIREERLTDHFGYEEFVKLISWERKKNIDLKQNHPYYGRMNIPEKLDRPARTIMATQFSVSRESMVIEDGRNKGVFRRPTPRECASLQGFPLTYQFWGNSIGSKYKLIGNAVPIGFARNIAKAILLDMKMPVPKSLKINSIANDIQPPPLEIPNKKSHMLRSNFHWHPIESVVNGCRVDLDNTLRYKPHMKPFIITKDLRHLCRWDAILHVGIGRPRWYCELIDPKAILESLRIADMGKDKEKKLLSLVKLLHGDVPDATTLLWAHRNPSRTWEKSCDGVVRPRVLLDRTDSIRKKIVRSKHKLVNCKEHIKICPKKGLPLITLVTAFILYWMCREINNCTNWMIHNRDERYIPPEWGNRGLCLKDRCGGVMSEDFPRSI